MPPLLQFVIRRFATSIVSLVVITLVLYAGVMLTPPEARAMLYAPPGRGGERMTDNRIQVIIRENHLDQPYLVQYGYWVRSLASGSWGYSPTLREDVLQSLLRRTPATLELTLYSLLLLIPLGLASGLLAGWRPRRPFDNTFRAVAFLGTSMPPFILSLVLLAIFYIRLQWFSPGRMDPLTDLEITKSGFHPFTGLLTIDSLLNGRWDFFIAALRHLAMPVLTLSIYHWAVLGRLTRAAMIDERGKDYILAARARGVTEPRLIWRHALRAILAPSLTGVALAAAALVTGVFVVEIIYAFNGVSQVIVSSMRSVPDAPAALGFAVYSVLMVTGLMFILDVLLAGSDPRIRDEILQI
jgi:ABC-type dipeptide/oligopeptide/nickel transport system permease component